MCRRLSACLDNLTVGYVFYLTLSNCVSINIDVSELSRTVWDF